MKAIKNPTEREALLVVGSMAVYARNALVALATMAVQDDGFCAHDVLETLRALGYRDVILEARKLARSSHVGRGRHAGKRRVRKK